MSLLAELLNKSKHAVLVSAAVRSWTLLLSIAPPHSIPSICCCSLPVLNKLLEWEELNVRVAVGVGVALLFELARDCESEEELLDSDACSYTYSLIQQLATESNRHTTRKDRNHTRSCFRDILLSLDVSQYSLPLPVPYSGMSMGLCYTQYHSLFHTLVWIYVILSTTACTIFWYGDMLYSVPLPVTDSGMGMGLCNSQYHSLFQTLVQ